jgi:MoaA/NifB/PqqE/SkfB family radical SAM enzyme
MIDSLQGLHIEPTNICTLKCSGCSRTRFIDQWPQHWQNHSLDIDQLLTFLDIDLADKQILLCGNYGDPIYHPEFIEFVEKLKRTGARIAIVTNGSYRRAAWWKSLTDLLDAQDTIAFSIDGVPENFTLYRKNADWDSIKVGIEISVASACRTIWKYIPFKFNQDNIDQARSLSKNLGMDEFMIDLSDRYDELTEDLRPDQAHMIGSRYTSMQLWKQQHTVSALDPKCKSGDYHFITADGHYSPCCYLADYRFYYKTLFGKNKNHYDITQTTLSQILSSPTVVEFYDNLDQNPGCQYNCSAHS